MKTRVGGFDDWVKLPADGGCTDGDSDRLDIRKHYVWLFYHRTLALFPLARTEKPFQKKFRLFQRLSLQPTFTRDSRFCARSGISRSMSCSISAGWWNSRILFSRTFSSRIYLSRTWIKEFIAKIDNWATGGVVFTSPAQRSTGTFQCLSSCQSAEGCLEQQIIIDHLIEKSFWKTEWNLNLV